MSDPTRDRIAKQTPQSAHTAAMDAFDARGIEMDADSVMAALSAAGPHIRAAERKRLAAKLREEVIQESGSRTGDCLRYAAHLIESEDQT